MSVYEGIMRGLNEAIEHVEGNCTEARTMKRMTNADRIRSMSDEELAKFVCRIDALDEICEKQDPTQDGSGCDEHHNCSACYLDWLQQPAREEENE